jgi:hypothetical protein
MAEINKPDVITDEAFNVPLQWAKHWNTAAESIERVIPTLMQINKSMGQASTISQVTKETEQLSIAQLELDKIQKQIATAQAKNNDAYIKEAKALEEVKKQIKEKTALGDRDAKSVNAQNASLKQLEAALNKNRLAYKNLAGEQERNSKEGKELLDIIKKQDAEFKELSGTIGQHQAHVGDYANQIGKANTAAQAIAPGLHGMASGFLTATKAAIAFIATPLGAVLALVALALAPLVTFLTSTGDGMDYVQKKTTGLKSGLGVLKDEFNDLGKRIFDNEESLGGFVKTMALSNPVTAVFLGQIELLRRAFPDLAKRFDEAREAGEQYAVMMDDIATRQRVFNVEIAVEENNIKRLILQSKNRTLNEQERIDLIDQALSKEQSLSKKRVSFAQNELNANVIMAEKRTKITRGLSETDDEYYRRLIDSLDKTEEALADSIAGALVNLEEAKGADIAITEKLLNQKDALEDKQAEKDKKRAEDVLKTKERIANATFLFEEMKLQQTFDNAKTLEQKENAELALVDLRQKHELDKHGLLEQEKKAIIEKFRIERLAVTKKYDEEERKLLIDNARKAGEKILEEKQKTLDEEINKIKIAVAEGSKTREEGAKLIAKKEKEIAIELIDEQIRQLEKLLLVEGLTATEQADINKKLYKLKNDLVDAYYKNLGDKDKTALENSAAFVAKLKEIYDAFAQEINTIFQNITDGKLQNIDLELKANDDALKSTLEAEKERNEKRLEDDTLTSKQREQIQDDAKVREALIEEQFAKKKEALEAKRLKMVQKAARFEKTLALIGAGIATASAVLNQLSKGDPYTAFARAALAGALGAVQIAAIASKPIPAYAEGTKSHKGGLAILGDGGGAELIREGHHFSLSPSVPTLMNLKKGAEVIPHEETLAMLAMSGLGRVSSDRRVSDPRHLQDLRDIKNVIKNKAFVRVNGQVTGYQRGGTQVNRLDYWRNI